MSTASARSSPNEKLPQRELQEYVDAEFEHLQDQLSDVLQPWMNSIDDHFINISKIFLQIDRRLSQIETTVQELEQRVTTFDGGPKDMPLPSRINAPPQINEIHTYTHNTSSSKHKKHSSKHKKHSTTHKSNPKT